MYFNFDLHLRDCSVKINFVFSSMSQAASGMEVLGLIPAPSTGFMCKYFKIKFFSGEDRTSPFKKVVR